MAHGVTTRQLEALSFMCSWRLDRGYWPTYHELAEGLGISRGSAHCLVSRLAEHGMAAQAQRHRGASATSAGWAEFRRFESSRRS